MAIPLAVSEVGDTSSVAEMLRLIGVEHRFLDCMNSDNAALAVTTSGRMSESRGFSMEHMLRPEAAKDISG